ncbi:hypothetical protein L3081_24865 [Colwellia sp. MSW7]|jgi:hypothetical protein|uniref:Uncharacterized protein n=1 Tax=Colwellia maritima TaxID=2912588 RepID=A0ABS9X738_9GAMM|nr:hypothetical protein [Colwellia maritima]MCI2286058.1 hypothetical protein [Colwellia maritima]
MDIVQTNEPEQNVIKINFNRKNITNLTKRQAMAMICTSNVCHIEQAGQHHGGVPELAYRLAQYVGNILPFGEANLLDYILSDALTAWDSVYEEQGARVAYQSYCMTIRELLPLVFNYRVSSKKRLMPYSAAIWNCVTQGIFEWLNDCQLNDVEIEMGSYDSTLTPKEMSLLVSHKVFSRIDMMHWGLPPEGFIDTKKEGGF